MVGRLRFGIIVLGWSGDFRQLGIFDILIRRSSIHYFVRFRRCTGYRCDRYSDPGRSHRSRPDIRQVHPFLALLPSLTLLFDQAVVTQGDDVVEPPSSGLLGLAWQSIAQTGATPFLQNLAQSGDLTTPEFAFYLERYQDDPNATADETSGGEFTVG